MTDSENPQTLPARAAPADPGWTPARMRYFLSRLADTGNVLGVCREMDMSRQSVYALRARDAAFARAWQGAALRHRDALVDLCMERATVGVTEEIVVDGALAERTKPDGAMLRHMLARADRRCDDERLAARPAQQSELRFEALLDCIDPPGEGRADGSADGAAAAAADRDALLACIGESANWNWDVRDYPGLAAPGSGGVAGAGPGRRAADADPLRGYAGEEEAVEALAAYKRLMATPPGEVDISDLDPEAAEGWTEEQWLRADHSGLADRLFGADGEPAADRAEDGADGGVECGGKGEGDP
ncbi:hypothetical protein HFP57_13425 [Parasphingopyxis algicola]|uniref:hypothetical protein n=1 Tax=Parasphingopyxis algicola TaxID=2026624 RepID=UPI0015A0AE7D|nr:hypothetical protein [Parasphingopyxis algicola]QLC25926.1 hypothetical protein HFP57_13425 [Parasphingopyxis algicola]